MDHANIGMHGVVMSGTIATVTGSGLHGGFWYIRCGFFLFRFRLWSLSLTLDIVILILILSTPLRLGRSTFTFLVTVTITVPVAGRLLAFQIAHLRIQDIYPLVSLLKASFRLGQILSHLLVYLKKSSHTLKEFGYLSSVIFTFHI